VAGASQIIPQVDVLMSLSHVSMLVNVNDDPAPVHSGVRNGLSEAIKC
jgi:hypothetical protein